MKLNPNSWHARWYTWRGANLPYDLCNYMWGLLFRTLWRLAVAMFFLLYIALSIHLTIEHPYVVSGVVLAMFLSLVILYLIIQPSKFILLVQAFVRTKRDKYCPIIEWKDKQ